MFLSNTANPTSVMKFYSNVMDDVLAGVRESFLDEGVDEQVLQELRQMWEAKVQASKAIDPPEVIEPQPPPLQITQPVQNDAKNINQLKQTNGVPTSSIQSSRAKPLVVANTPTTPLSVPPPLAATSITSSTQQPQMVSLQPPQLPQAVPQPVVNNLQDKLVPIQLTLPAPPGSQDNQSRIYNIQVPASALATDQLKRILTAQVISATMALPTNVASTLLQQHVTAALQSQANNTQANPNVNNSSSAQLNGVQGVLLTDNSNNRQFPHLNQISGNITQVDGTHCLSDDEFDNNGSPTSSAVVSQKKAVKASSENKNILVLQLDGIYDTSDDDEDDDDDDDLDDDDDDDDDDENDDKEEDNDEAENGVEEDPLNSGDDVSEGDNTDLFETENVVVCQYDKINRSRNKWKFYLKDGIMNLAGRDYIFQKANGDAEW